VMFHIYACVCGGGERVEGVRGKERSGGGEGCVCVCARAQLCCVPSHLRMHVGVGCVRVCMRADA